MLCSFEDDGERSYIQDLKARERFLLGQPIYFNLARPKVES